MLSRGCARSPLVAVVVLAGVMAGHRPVVAHGANRIAPSNPPPPTFVVAIDPGHGGSNLGAAGIISGGGDAREADRTIFEKQVTLSLARRLRELLSDHPGFRVVLCRDGDVMVPIRARARCAEQARADLFITLHANATPPGLPRGSRRGFEVYVLSPQEREDDAALAGARAADPRAADPTAGVWAAHEALALGERSILAARLISDRLRDSLGAGSSRGVRQTGAPLDVLRGAGAPSVLVEVGFIDHPSEGVLLTSRAGQDVIAAALATAVTDFADR